MGNIDGFKKALEALQYLDSDQQIRILSQIAKQDPALAEKLKNGLLTFSDLQYLAANDFQKIWRAFNESDWHLALRGAPQEVLDFLKSQLSQRAFARLQEDIKSLGPQPMSKVIDLREKIVGTLQDWSTKGEIARPMKSKGGKMV